MSRSAIGPHGFRCPGRGRPCAPGPLATESHTSDKSQLRPWILHVEDGAQ